MLADGATHIGVATDHVIESFRNDVCGPATRRRRRHAAELLAQFPLLEEALMALGVKVWPMVELEADDALASAAAVAADDDRRRPGRHLHARQGPRPVRRGRRVVQLDRRSGKVIDAAGVEAKFGVRPSRSPDYLALVGDSADGFPGLPGWGAKSAAAVLARYGHIEDIPADVADWDGVNVRSAGTLAATLAADRDHALLFKDLATLRVDRSLLDDVDQLRWTGTTDAFPDVCARIDAAGILERATRLNLRAEYVQLTSWARASARSSR